MRAKLLVALVGGLIAASATANGAIVVDQSQLINDAPIAGFSQRDLAQSFKPTFNNITGASIQLYTSGSGSATVTISLYDALPNAAGNLLATGSDFGVSAGQWADVSFASAIAVIPNATYYLVFTGSNQDLLVAGGVDTPYTRGNTFANTGYQSYPTLDYAFQTYSDNQIEVPEPTSMALFGLGAIGFVAARRRRQAA